MKHKHAEYIKQWVDGIECEYFFIGTDRWVQINDIAVFSSCDVQVRIKPEPKPDNVAYSIVYQYEDGSAYVTHAMKNKTESYNLKLTFDGETGKLKSAEVIKNV